MKIDIHANNVNLTDKLSEYINKKVNKLQKIHSYILDTAVFLKEESPLVKEVQLRLNVKNHSLVCKEHGETFEIAIDTCVDAMKRQLEKHKEK